MTSGRPGGLPASIRQRLLNLSRERRESFQRVLDRFALERFLYRLGRSPYASVLVLKGAFALDVWSPLPTRPTRDADFGGPPGMSEEELASILRATCEVGVERDGIAYDPETVRVQEIRRNRAEGGFRASLLADLAGARSTVRIDVGLGDVVVPPPETREFSTLLDLPAPRLRVSPPEPMIAEKLEAMVALGFANSRMKDFHDIVFLADSLGFEGRRLVEALRATFTNRGTPLPAEAPSALTGQFLHDGSKEQQWRAFLRTAEIEDERSLGEIGQRIRRFVLPPLHAATTGKPFDVHWPPGGPWPVDEKRTRGKRSLGP